MNLRHVSRKSEEGRALLKACKFSRVDMPNSHCIVFYLITHGSLCFTKLDDKPLHTEEISVDSAVEIYSPGQLSFYLNERTVGNYCLS